MCERILRDSLGMVQRGGFDGDGSEQSRED